MAKLERGLFCNFFGEMYQYRLSTLITITVVNTFVIIDDFIAGLNRGFTFQNGQELKCIKAGKYKVDWVLCFEDGNNTNWEGDIFLNGIAQQKTAGCRKLGANDEGSMSGSGILQIARDDIIDLRIKNTATTDDATIIIANVNLVRLNK